MQREIKKTAKNSKPPQKISVHKQQSNDYQLIACSFHESSHAILGLANFIHINFVSINPNHNGGDIGNTDYNNLESKDLYLNKLMVKAEVQMLIAGLAGEKIYYRDITGSNKFPMHLKRGSWDDIANASLIIRKSKIVAPGVETSLFKKKNQQDVEKFLSDHWIEVKLVSHQLYKKQYLSFDDLKSILTRKNPHKEFWVEKFKKIKLLYDHQDDISEETIKTLLSPKI